MPTSKRSALVAKLLAPGSQLAGKYVVVDSLGTGAFSHVVRARHEVMERDVAIKVLKPEVVDSDPDVHDRFLTEARIVSRLHHPNTVTVFDFGETTDGLLYMVLEFVRGQGLDTVLKDGALPTSRVVHITKQILKSLDEAHAIGVVHRDLKPANIMLTTLHGEPDFVKVLDFGVAKLAGKKEEGATPRRSTRFIGTPVYMSPEQVLGEEVSPSSDLYSLGLILYEMLTGDPPVDTSLNVAGVAQIHIDTAPIPFAKFDQLPKSFRTLLRKATARRREDRFQSVREFARALPRETIADSSSEFRQIVGEDDDVFSGKHYIALPDESEGTFAPDIPAAPGRTRTRPTPMLDRAVMPTRTPRQRAATNELQLDIGKLKRDQIQKRRGDEPVERKRAQALPESSELVRRSLWLVGSAAMLFVSFVFVTSLFKASGGGRLFIFGIHLFAIALWAQFSTVRNTRGTFFERWVVPFAQHSVYLGGLEILVLLLAAPRYVRSALQSSGGWVLEFLRLPEDGLVGSVVYAVVGVLEAVFAFVGSIVPW